MGLRRRPEEKNVFFLDKAPRLSISNDIWILSSDTDHYLSAQPIVFKGGKAVNIFRSLPYLVISFPTPPTYTLPPPLIVQFFSGNLYYLYKKIRSVASPPPLFGHCPEEKKISGRVPSAGTKSPTLS